MNLIEVAEQFALERGYVIGFCDASPLDKQRLQSAAFVPFVRNDLEKRTNPASVMPDVKSIIVLGIGHGETSQIAASVAKFEAKRNTGANLAPVGDTSAINEQKYLTHDSNIERSRSCNTIRFPQKLGEAHENVTELESVFVRSNGVTRMSTAELSSLGRNADYHPIVKDALSNLAIAISSQIACNTKILVDSPLLDERALAHRANLGFFGRNGLIISPVFGTMFNIGILLTDIPLPQAHTQTKLKGCPPKCKTCIEACPTGALADCQPLNSSRCLSYLTQKRNLTVEDEAILANGGQLYGCDICQISCPYNMPRTRNYVNLQEWVSKTDEDFMHDYGHTAMFWQGTDILRRNAQLLLQPKETR